MTITIPCADGSDPECEGELVHIPEYIGLTKEQVDEIKFQGGQATIKLSHQQMKMNNLTENMVDYCDVEKCAWIEIDFDTTCVPCGSND